jgi:hypothetical protein
VSEFFLDGGKAFGKWGHSSFPSKWGQGSKDR